ncbi:unnamed protein product [Calicophoron daubneyi]|uniref:protein-serine/threonine phosphatase n=1 Tax=Calicophoron daubneyi TaxID=300641 RepID=A0AAV2T7A2_CALDB
MEDNILQTFTMNKATKRAVQATARSLIVRLSDRQIFKGVKPSIKEREVTSVCRLLMEIVVTESVCLEVSLSDPLYIVGDILGHYKHLMHLFNAFGVPPQTHYLFLGNYADVGRMGLETLILLCCYKVLYPNSIYLLRGKHEVGIISRDYGLLDECNRRFSQRMWHSFTTLFAYLPVVAIVEEKILCLNGGLSPTLCSRVSRLNLKNLLRTLISKSEELKPDSLLCHLLWSSPDPETKGWEQNPVGLGYLFGPEVVRHFCEKAGITQIIRSSEFVLQGYELFDDTRLLTIFSAPNFMSTYGNKGAIVKVQKAPGQEFSCGIVTMTAELRRLSSSVTREVMNFQEVDFHIDAELRKTDSDLRLPPVTCK